MAERLGLPVAVAKATLGEAEFQRWREFIRREPTAADRLEYWLSWLVTAFLNAHRQPGARPLSVDRVRQDAVDLAGKLPDRWRDGPPVVPGRLKGKALGQAFKAWAKGRAGRRPRAKPGG